MKLINKKQAIEPDPKASFYTLLLIFIYKTTF